MEYVLRRRVLAHSRGLLRGPPVRTALFRDLTVAPIGCSAWTRPASTSSASGADPFQGRGASALARYLPNGARDRCQQRLARAPPIMRTSSPLRSSRLESVRSLGELQRWWLPLLRQPSGLRRRHAARARPTLGGGGSPWTIGAPGARSGGDEVEVGAVPQRTRATTICSPTPGNRRRLFLSGRAASARPRRHHVAYLDRWFTSAQTAEGGAPVLVDPSSGPNHARFSPGPALTLESLIRLRAGDEVFGLIDEGRTVALCITAIRQRRLAADRDCQEDRIKLHG
jgi:hypothetical protein